MKNVVPRPTQQAIQNVAIYLRQLGKENPEAFELKMRETELYARDSGDAKTKAADFLGWIREDFLRLRRILGVGC